MPDKDSNRSTVSPFSNRTIRLNMPLSMLARKRLQRKTGNTSQRQPRQQVGINPALSAIWIKVGVKCQRTFAHALFSLLICVLYANGLFAQAKDARGGCTAVFLKNKVGLHRQHRQALVRRAAAA
jgi:hypothetical protein